MPKPPPDDTPDISPPEPKVIEFELTGKLTVYPDGRREMEVDGIANGQPIHKMQWRQTVEQLFAWDEKEEALAERRKRPPAEVVEFDPGKK